MKSITFAVASNNDDILNANLLASPALRGEHAHEIIIQRGYTAATSAYNDAIARCSNDLVVFLHHDLVLPETWIAELFKAIDYLEQHDPKWGVLGCFGVTKDNARHGYVYSSGRGVLGRPFPFPMPVQTLDEIILVVKKSSGLRFDATLPHFHCYGADICLKAQSLGMRSYAIAAYCIHNTQELVVLPSEFYECCRHLRTVWKQYLPIQTSCIRLTRSNLPVIGRRVKELYLKYVRKTVRGAGRLADASTILSPVSQD